MAVTDSVFVVAWIFIVDFMADNMRTSEKALRHLMDALGLLMGLTWEAAFDQAAETTEERFAADNLRKRIVLKICVAVGLCTVVLPAWRWYILPKVQESE